MSKLFMRNLILLLFFLCAGILPASAQSWELGGGLGASGYLGDLNQANVFKFTDVAFSGFFKRNFNQYLSARMGFTHGRLQGDDVKSKNQQFRDRNINFVTP
ncbi:MAG: hypothetical protein INR69_20135, partial [Mucilaginibacter polytrichastri]|nr:hypothetical protein [Mucilaginibacter polytrichastri]